MGLFSRNKDSDVSDFNATTKFGLMKIDDEKKLFKAARKVFKFEDLISFELIQDNQKVVEGGIDAGRALLGGSFFGKSGATVGSLSKVKKADKEYCSSIQILFTVKNNKRATHTISVLAMKLDTSSTMYSQHNILAKSTMEGFNYIVDCNKSVGSTDSAIDNFENLKKLKELLDMGILTQEEFDRKKSELLK